MLPINLVKGSLLLYELDKKVFSHVDTTHGMVYLLYDIFSFATSSPYVSTFSSIFKCGDTVQGIQTLRVTHSEAGACVVCQAGPRRRTHTHLKENK